MQVKAVILAVAFAGLCGLLSACTGYNNTSIPNVPYLNLDIHKQTHLLTTTDRLCVFNGGDMITNTGTRYQNSGRFMHKIVVNTFQMYNLEGAVDMKHVNAVDAKPFDLQDQARSNSCNLIAITRPIFWQDSQISPSNVGLNIDMYDTSSLELVNSVTLNARSKTIGEMFTKNSPLRPVIETYINELYK